MASDGLPTTVPFPEPLPAHRDGDGWVAVVDGGAVRLSNLDKVFWGPEGYTKADLVTYYHNMASWILPYLQDRPLTLKRMPDGVDGEFFYAKQAPGHTPDWVSRAAVVSHDTGKTIDYLLAQDRPTLLWLANLGCVEMHPLHARTDDIGRPDYAFFDLDPMGVDFATVRQVALLVRTALDQLGVRGYPRTSGATGMQVYVPVDRVHSASEVREWVRGVCRLIHRADPRRTSMEVSVAQRGRTVYLDHAMNTEGRTIAATYSLRPERAAPVATPLRWDEVEEDVEPADFTIETVWDRLADAGDLFAPVLEGGQDLRAAMEALGIRPAAEAPPAHTVTDLRDYTAKRDFSRTPEPTGDESVSAGGGGPRFVIQHHLATRLHHDLRLERDGTLPSWALPKGLPDIPGLRHLAVRTEDHPLGYLEFEGDIPAGEYGAGPMRVWDRGTYEELIWEEGKVTVRLHGRRHQGVYHLFRTSDDDPKQWLAIRKDEPAPGELPQPVPRLTPMLAVARDTEPFDDPAWLFEVKWDGVRALASTVRPGAGGDGETRLTSRQGNDISPAYPELAATWERVLARNALLDGEIVAFGADGVPSFERLQQRMHVRDAAAIERLRRQVPVVYMVFDLLVVDGQSLCDLPLTERHARLDELLVPGGAVQRSEAVAGQGVALHEAAVGRGLEGTMAKRAASRYRPGRRSPDWRKVKRRHQIRCVIGGWQAGTGRRAGRLGSLLVGLYDADGRLRYAGQVGSGFDEDELAVVGRLLAEREVEASPFDPASRPPRAAGWVRPELVCEVAYTEVTAGGKLRAPSYLRLVEDAEPRACTFDELV
jgi:bifunctional non-homologous end joining protein LigD